MFTALFMTRFYFNGWLQNPKKQNPFDGKLDQKYKL